MPEVLSKRISDIAVVIPNYQGEKYIADCLYSLVKQNISGTGMRMTVRIVENGSSDHSKEEMIRFLTETGYRKQEKQENTITKQEQRIDDSVWECYLPEKAQLPEIQILFLNENSGFCHAVNRGIQASNEKYVFLLNNDTTVEANCVKELFSFMERQPKAFSAGAKMVSMKQPEIADDCGDYFNALGYAFAVGKGKRSEAYKEERTVFSACGGAVIYRNEIFDEIGLFDEHHFAYLEDVDLGYRARIYGYQNYFVPSAVVYHAGSAVSGSRHNAFKVRLSSKNSVYLVYKNQPFLQWLLNFPFLLMGYLIKVVFFARKGLGTTYLKGLFYGMKFCFSKEAKEHKVKFCMHRFHHYVKIQLELWINLLRMLGFCI